MTRTSTVIAFPFAGGSSFSYAKLTRYLPAGMAWTTLDPPGHGKRMQEPLMNRIAPMARDLAPRVREAAGGLPYTLFGHSMGSYLALAVLDELVRLGHPLPQRLVLSGAAPPQRHQSEHISALPQAAFLQRVLAMGGVPAQVLEEPELVALFEPILRAGFEAAETYDQARRWAHPVPVRVLRGTEDRLSASDQPGWASCFATPPEVLDFPGGHFFLFDQAEAVVLAIIS